MRRAGMPTGYLLLRPLDTDPASQLLAVKLADERCPA